MSQNKLFFGNLAFKLDENDLQTYFEPFGTILNVKIPTDRETGRKRGFAFVTFESPDAASVALTMNGKEIEGREIRVNLAEEMLATLPLLSI